MDDLLKEAIADAKAVRETALQNAKIALEEAFTPKLHSMLSKKIQAETEGEAEEGEEYEEDGEEEGGEEAPAPEAGGEDDDDKDVDVDVGDDDDDSEEEAEEGEEVPAEEAEYEEDEEEATEDLDLEAIIRELEAEEEGEEPSEEGEGEEVDETIEVNGVRYQPIKEEEDEEGDEVAENNDVSSDIGKGDNKQPATKANDDDTEDPEGDSTHSQKMGEGRGQDTANTSDRKAPGKEVEEEIDLDEVLKMLGEEEETEEDETKDEEVKQLKSDLEEHRSVIKIMKGKLNEVNLLNAKLLFTNKLFKNFNLSNDQKMKVVETFDRAGSLREVKLVYSTIAESFGYAGSQTISKSFGIKESASKPVKSTKPTKKVISEGADLSDRFKKLAGIK